MIEKNRIEEYLLGRLTAQERTEFEQELAPNPELRRQTEQMEQIITAFEKKAEQPTLDALRRISSQEVLMKIIREADQNRPQIKNFRKVYLYVAAVAAVLIIGWIGIQPKYSSTELYSEYFTVEQYELAPSRGGDWVPEDSVIYSAIVRAEKGETEPAIEMLTTIADNPQAQLQDDARWNIALIYLRSNDRDKAKITLLKIIDENTQYAEKAKKLLIKIEKRRWF